MDKSPLRPATITIALKKAGFRPSEYLKSCIRGWGNSTEGFEVEGDKEVHYSNNYSIRGGRKYWPRWTEYTGKVFVRYVQSTNISRKWDAELQKRKTNELEAALKGMGYKVSREPQYHDSDTEQLIVERAEV